jgi:hypothetical protein
MPDIAVSVVTDTRPSKAPELFFYWCLRDRSMRCSADADAIVANLFIWKLFDITYKPPPRKEIVEPISHYDVMDLNCAVAFRSTPHYKLIFCAWWPWKIICAPSALEHHLCLRKTIRGMHNTTTHPRDEASYNLVSFSFAFLLRTLTAFFPSNSLSILTRMPLYFTPPLHLYVRCTFHDFAQDPPFYSM